MADRFRNSKVVALAGGVGGAKLAHGLQMALPEGALSIIVNTADDFRLWGLNISPDLDTVMYTLGGVANTEWGWGVEGDTWQAMDMLARYGRDTWFRLGDRDLATHVLRTQLLSEGKSLTEVTNDLSGALGIKSAIIPMSDQPVQTLIETQDGTLDFQDYFVRRRHSDTVTGITFRGIGEARPTNEALAAIEGAEAIILCPSNPFVSIGPLLGVPGMRDAIERSQAVKVAVSPIVGGAALKGPAADMMSALGHKVSPAGVAALYRGLVRGMVIDVLDGNTAGEIQDMDMAICVTDTVMKSDENRLTLARDVLQFCDTLRSEREVAR